MLIYLELIKQLSSRSSLATYKHMECFKKKSAAWAKNSTLSFPLLLHTLLVCKSDLYWWVWYIFMFVYSLVYCYCYVCRHGLLEFLSSSIITVRGCSVLRRCVCKYVCGLCSGCFKVFAVTSLIKGL